MPRVYHTQDDSLICGGAYNFPSTFQSCSKWDSDSGTWNQSITLPRERQRSQSWTPNSGVGTYLIGGYVNSNTTDLVKPDGTVQQGFDLKYDSRYLSVLQICFFANFSLFSYCSTKYLSSTCCRSFLLLKAIATRFPLFFAKTGTKIKQRV